jgi:hypothetical protein
MKSAFDIPNGQILKALGFCQCRKIALYKDPLRTSSLFPVVSFATITYRSDRTLVKKSSPPPNSDDVIRMQRKMNRTSPNPKPTTVHIYGLVREEGTEDDDRLPLNF